MKKLILTAAIVCAAAFAQAATVDWNLYNYDPVPSTDGIGTYTGEMTLACVELGYSTTVYVNGGDFDVYKNVISDDQKLEAVYTWTLTATTPTHTYLAIATGETDASGNGMCGFDAGTWTAVPEPTSGLLLLLGVAGLALKRKRA